MPIVLRVTAREKEMVVAMRVARVKVRVAVKVKVKEKEKGKVSIHLPAATQECQEFLITEENRPLVNSMP